MRGIQKCNKIGLMVNNVQARLFEKEAFPKCPVHSSYGPILIGAVLIKRFRKKTPKLNFEV
jgi:hypothetical protein